jgi:hypothetical protein
MARFTFAANGIISGPINAQSAEFEVVPGESLSVNGVPLVGSITAQLPSGITLLTVDTPITNGTSTLHFSMVVGAACFGEGGCVSDVSFLDPITITGASAFDANGNLVPGTTFVSESGFNPNAQSVAPGLYDDFSGGFINPSKWTVSPMCGGNAYDCAREVRSGHLRLAVRGYGDPNSDSGISFAASQVMFRTPNAIDSIELHLKVRTFSSSACPTNSDAAHPQFLISGTFFNTGTGDASGDVSGFLMVERRTDDTFDAPGVLRVGGFMSLNGQFFNNVDLGTLQVGEGAQATLRWDHTNHALVVRIVKSVTTPSIVEQSMPYALPDSQLPFVAVKSIQAGSFAPNCTSQRSVAAMDANVDNVRVNVGP